MYIPIYAGMYECMDAYIYIYIYIYMNLAVRQVCMVREGVRRRYRVVCGGGVVGRYPGDAVSKAVVVVQGEPPPNGRSEARPGQVRLRRLDGWSGGNMSSK